MRSVDRLFCLLLDELVDEREGVLAVAAGLAARAVDDAQLIDVRWRQAERRLVEPGVCEGRILRRRGDGGVASGGCRGQSGLGRINELRVVGVDLALGEEILRRTARGDRHDMKVV